MIEGLHRKLCAPKVVEVVVVGISGFPLRSPETKSHLHVALVENYKVHYMGKVSGFPRIQAMVSLVSPKSPIARPGTKGASKNKLTNSWLVGCKFK